MTVTNVSTARADYVGNGSTTIFTVPFRILDEAHISVTLIVGAVETTQVLNTDYTVQNVGDPTSQITMTVAPTSLQTVVIVRNVPPTQLLDYVESDKFPSQSHEDGLDKLTMIVQQQNELISRLDSVDLSGNPITASVNDLAAAKALAAGAYTVIFLRGRVTVGDGGKGYFLWVAGDKSTEVAADTQNGIWIPPDSDNTGASGAWQRVSDTDWMNVKWFGAKGDNSTNDHTAIQAAIDYTLVDGGTVFFPPGTYRVSTKLHLDLRGITGSPATNTRRVDVVGSGAGGTVIESSTDSQTIFHVQGDNPLTSASHTYASMRDISFSGAAPTSRTEIGLRLEDIAYFNMQNVSFHNLNLCMTLVGCLSSTFYSLEFNESTNGVQTSAAASGPHANAWFGCIFRQITALGYQGFTTQTGTLFSGCNFESCGTHATANNGAVLINLSGSAGETGPTFLNCYFEINGGDFDIELNETASQRISCSVIGCAFNRTSSTKFATNCIVTSGDIDLNLLGNAFTSYNTYTADAGRPYLNLGATTRFRDLGNRYEDAVEGPTVSQALPYMGFVQGSLGASVTGTLPNGWSVAHTGTGLFTITHNLGHTDYALVATTNSNVNRTIERSGAQGTNTILVKVTDTSNVSTDDDFSFMLGVLKPR